MILMLKRMHNIWHGVECNNGEWAEAGKMADGQRSDELA
jgi:hypothetical protein